MSKYAPRLPKRLKAKAKRPPKGEGVSSRKVSRRAIMLRRLQENSKGSMAKKAAIGTAAVGGAYIGGRLYQRKKDREAFEKGNFIRRYKVNSSRWRPGGNV